MDTLRPTEMTVDKVGLTEWLTNPLTTFEPVSRQIWAGFGGSVCGQSAVEDDRSTVTVSVTVPLTCGFLVAGAGFEPATSGL